MNRVGMVVEARTRERTTLDAIARRPSGVGHALNCAALVGHPRCKSDAVLRAMAARGGVMGITAVRAFVRQPEAPSLDDLLDHFDHVARVAGAEHVGLGSDVDVDARDPRTGRVRPAYAIDGLNPSRRPSRCRGLLRRGWREADVEAPRRQLPSRASVDLGAPPAEPMQPLPPPQPQAALPVAG